MFRLCNWAYGGKEEIVIQIQMCYYVKVDINDKIVN